MTHTQPGKQHSYFRNTLYIFLVRFFPALAALLVLVQYARRLDKPDYGIYQNFWVQYYILSTVACAGIHVFLVTYSPGFLVRLARSIKPVIWIGIAAWMLLCAAGFGLLQLHGPGALSFAIPFLFLFFSSLITIAESALFVFRRFRFLAITNVLYSLIFVWLHEGLLTKTGDMPAAFFPLFLYLTVLCGIRLLACIWAVYSCYRTTAPDTEKVTPGKVRSLWLHMGLYDMLQVVFRWVDKFFISLLLTASASAIYFNGSIDIPFLPLVLGAAGSAGLIQLAQHDRETARELHARRLVLYSGRMLSCIVFPLFFFLVFFRTELFAVVFDNRYTLSVPVFLVSLLSVPLRAYSFTTVLQHYHQGRIINTGAALDLVLACALMYPSYLLGGLPGVAFAFTITTYIQAGYYLYHSARLLQVSWWQLMPLKNWGIKLIVFFIFFISLHYLLVEWVNPQIALILGSCALAAVTLAALVAELNRSKRNYGKTGT